MAVRGTASVPRVQVSGGPIRVALVTHSFDCGGIERAIAYLANHLPRPPFEPYIVCLTTSGAAERWLERRVPVVQLFKPPHNDAAVVWRLAETLKRFRTAIVHSHNWGTLVECTLARRLAGTPVHVHSERGTVLGTLEEHGWRCRARAVAMRLALTQVDCVVSNARATAERVERLTGYPSRRVQVVPNGVPCPVRGDWDELRRQVRAALGVDEETVVVGTVARLDPVKNLGLLLEALALARRQGAKVVGLIVGDGPERPKLESMAAGLGLDRAAHFVGYCAETGPYYAAMDVYANTSVSEGMSQAIVEAMAAGLPIVATAVGDTPRLIGQNGDCGCLVRSGDVAGFGTALVQLALHPARRRLLGHVSKRRYEELHSLAVMIDRYARLYADLLRSRSPAGAHRRAELLGVGKN